MSLDSRRVKRLMAWSLILDGRNLLQTESISALSFEYNGVSKKDALLLRLPHSIDTRRVSELDLERIP